MLLAHGANPNQADNYGHRALLEAARQGAVEIITLLLEHAADPNLASFQDVSALMRACSEGHYDAARVLLHAGADAAHIAARDGEHALSLSAKAGHASCVRLLLEHGVPVDARTGADSTALMASASQGQASCLRILLGHRADVDATDSTGMHGAMLAAMIGDMECLQLLCDADADVNQPGPAGASSLLVASMRGHAECVQRLCAYGATHGVEEAETAHGHGHTELADWLTTARSWSTSLHHVAVLPAARAVRELRCGAGLHERAAAAGAPTPLELAERLEACGQAPPGSAAHAVLQAALPWSRATHHLWPPEHRRWASAVVRLGLLLAWRCGELAPLAEVMERHVIPLALSRAAPPVCPTSATIATGLHSSHCHPSHRPQRAAAATADDDATAANDDTAAAEGGEGAPPPLSTSACRLHLCSLPTDLLVRVLVSLRTADLSRVACVATAFVTAAAVPPAVSYGRETVPLVEEALRQRCARRGAALPTRLPAGEASWVSWLCWEERRTDARRRAGRDDGASVSAAAASHCSACVVRGVPYVLWSADDDEGEQSASPPGPTRPSEGTSSGRSTPRSSAEAAVGLGALSELGRGGQAWLVPPGLPAAPFSGGAALEVDTVAVGGEHLLALTRGGQLLAWGANGVGQLGHGDCDACTAPRRVAALAGARASDVAAGAFHSMAVVEGTGGTAWVYTWGFGGDCALGHGGEATEALPCAIRNLDGARKAAGRAVTGPPKASAVAAGSRHSLALCQRGRVWGWGQGSSGQLGVDDDVLESATPLPLVALADVALRAIAAGEEHSVAIDVGDQLWLWGRLDHQHAAAAHDEAARRPHLPRPLPLDGVRVRSVAAGATHCVALSWSGAVYTWGRGRSGQLGHGSEHSVPTPRRVEGLGADVVAVAAGGAHSVAIAAAGSMLWGWGVAACVRGDEPEEISEISGEQEAPMAADEYVRPQLVFHATNTSSPGLC